MALFAKITRPMTFRDEQGRAEVYTSMEIQPNFANTGKCYLVGWPSPMTRQASARNTGILPHGKTQPPEPLQISLKPDFSGNAVELEFEDLPETVFTALTEKVKSIFGRKQASDDARLNDVHEAVTAVLNMCRKN
ncbi:phage capsid scaffolding (GPO) serine peptidase family protein [Escherichia coli]|nr:phage capsid scaffolding (GPO) serine peptidase family protein [Escherichia coli]